jgi:kynurenine formamidase
MDFLPRYRELPEAPGGGRHAWQLAEADGADIGLLRLQDPGRVLAAAGEIRTGQVFALTAPLDRYDPPLYGRARARHRLIADPDDGGFDDELSGFNPQAGSQWDSLAHVPADRGVFYNGVGAAEIAGGHRNTIEHWAARGIVGRGVLLDVAGMHAADSPGGAWSPGRAEAITVAELEQCRRSAGVRFEPGDVLLLYTGFDRWYLDQPAAQRAALADECRLAAAGLEHSEEMAEYLWDAHVSAVASDNPAVEVWPPDWRSEAHPFGFLHHVLIGRFGMALGELWWLADLVEACRGDGRYTMFVASAPLPVPGGVSSPANALAVR